MTGPGVRASAGLVAVATAALALAAPAPAAAAQLLNPDLVTHRPQHLTLDTTTEPQKVLLRFSNTVFDVGAGPLEVVPGQASTDCNGDGTATDHLAYQYVYEDTSGDGVFERDQDTGFQRELAGCKYFHPAHNHWHFDDFARYALRSQLTGQLVAVARKVSFCLGDSWHQFPDLPGSPESRYYGFSCREYDTQGISIGWGDTYSQKVYGQWVDVTGLPRGYYCLRSTADPDDHLDESREGNNARGALLRLNLGTMQVVPLHESC